MKAMWVLAGVFICSCVESNPQPSPGGSGEPGLDVAALDDIAASDTTAEIAVPDLASELPRDDVPSCVPDCSIHFCGDDGCGGSCGPCPDNSSCEGGSCACLWEYCQESAGPEGGGCCDEGQICDEAGFCCSPNCIDKECGNDGCGGTCGYCPPGHDCDDGGCFDPCEPFHYEVETEQAMRLDVLDAGPGGYPGYAMDLDGAPATCAPPDACQGGLDNSMQLLSASLLDTDDDDKNMGDFLATVGSHFLYRLHVPGLGGDQATLVIFAGVPEQAEDVCDWHVEPCPFLVDPSLIGSDSCLPIMQLGGELDGTHLSVGGSDALLDAPIPLGGAALSLTFYGVRMEATVKTDGDGAMSMTDGVFAGFFDKQEFIDAFPEPGSPFDLPIPPDIFDAILGSFLVPDMDQDGDGIPESVSFGFRIEAKPASISGFIEE